METATIDRQWGTLENVEMGDNFGMVRLGVEPDQDNYFDIYGEPEGYTNADGAEVTAEQERQDIIDLIDRDGIWWVFAEYRISPRHPWEIGDSIGMIIGANNPYEDDLKSTTIDQLRDALRDRCRTCRQTQ